METFLLTVAVFVTAVLALSLGTLLGKRPIKGSCGGADNVSCAACAACRRPCAKRRGAHTAGSKQPAG
jgi:hypothetical protein